jgi:hypothetical protein
MGHLRTALTSLPAKLRRPVTLSRAGAIAAFAAPAVLIAASDSWRTAAAAVLAAGTIRATRARFSGAAAVGLLVIVTLAVIGGAGPATSSRVMSSHRVDDSAHRPVHVADSLKLRGHAHRHAQPRRR